MYNSLLVIILLFGALEKSTSTTANFKSAQLIHHWPMDNQTDIIGSANFYGGRNFAYVDDRFNRPKSAIHLHKGFLQIPTGAYFNGDFTVTAWIKLRADQPWVRIIDFGEPANNDNLFITTIGRKSNVAVGSSITVSEKTIFRSSKSEMYLEVWYHLGVVLSGKKVSVYINGRLKEESTGDFVIPRNVIRTENFIGRSNYLQQGDEDADAVYDELKIFKGALTSEEIEKDFMFNQTETAGPKNSLKASNCYELLQAGQHKDGIYDIYPDPENDENSLSVYCEMKKGGWTRIMNRASRNPVSFHKDMNDFIEGFGDINSDYWMGLQNMVDMTNTQRMSLRVELSNSKEDKKINEYDLFFIESKSDDFKLKLGEKTFGSLNDDFSKHNGMKFSTKDNHNGPGNKNCANEYLGGWWFKDCYNVCLTCGMNGQWTIINSDYHSNYNYIKMLIRPYNMN